MIFKKWGIFLANLDPVIGSEQGKTRPVIIISENEINLLLNTVTTLPITTRKNNRLIYPNETLIKKNNFGLKKESVILCNQIRTLDKKRFISYLGEVDILEKQSEILHALSFLLGININK